MNLRIGLFKPSCVSLHFPHIQYYNATSVEHIPKLQKNTMLLAIANSSSLV